MKIQSLIVAYAFIFVVSCGGDDMSSPETISPTTLSLIATPTDPVSSFAPDSAAAKDTPESGIASTESQNIEVDADAGIGESASVVVGTPVTIHVMSGDEQDFHLHGYDIELSGDDVTFEFTADIAGEFELESHDSGELLLTLSVIAE